MALDRDKEEESAGIPEWVVTFGDMMSLLLTFFIMLFSMSKLKEEEFSVVVEALHRQFGSTASIASVVPGKAMPLNSAVNKLAILGRARRQDTMRGGDKVRAPVGDNPQVQSIRKAPDPTTGGNVFFKEGLSELDADGRQALEVTADEIRGKPQKIEVAGHTTSRPLEPNSPYRNHHDLAYDRCVKVREFLINSGIDPYRISMVVAGDSDPAYTGDDPVLAATRNARVEVKMYSQLVHREQKRSGGNAETTPDMPQVDIFTPP